MDRLFTHTQFLSADASSPTAGRFSALCHLHRLCASVRRLCISINAYYYYPVLWSGCFLETTWSSDSKLWSWFVSAMPIYV